jgi:hypothetical protein
MRAAGEVFKQGKIQMEQQADVAVVLKDKLPSKRHHARNV